MDVRPVMLNTEARLRLQLDVRWQRLNEGQCRHIFQVVKEIGTALHIPPEMSSGHGNALSDAAGGRPRL